MYIHTYIYIIHMYIHICIYTYVYDLYKHSPCDVHMCALSKYMRTVVPAIGARQKTPPPPPSLPSPATPLSPPQTKTHILVLSVLI